MANRINKLDPIYFVDDGAKRGPLTMSRVLFHPTEATLLALCVDRRVAMWNLDGEPREVKGRKEKCVVGELLCPHEIGWIRGFDVHPNGAAVATGGSDRSLRIWNWNAGRPEEKPAQQVAAHEGWVESVAYSPDGATIATAGADRTIKIWNAADLRLLRTLTGQGRYAAEVVFTRDGRTLISGGEDGRVLVRDTQSWQVVRTIEFGGANDQYGQIPRHSGVHRLAVSHDDRWLAVAGGDKCDVFDLASGEIVASERTAMDAAFHPSANVLAAGESEVRCWEFVAEKLTPSDADKNGKRQSPKALPGEVVGSVKRGDWSLGMRFSRDGTRLALGKADGTVEVYDVA